MNNKKGFTLVEVLAVIVVLGLISVIIVPKVINTVNDSEKKSYEASVNNLVKALNGISADKRANLISFEGCSIDFDNDVNTCTDLDFSGELPTSGSIIVDSNGNVNGSVGYEDSIFNIINNKVLFNDYIIGYQELDYIMSDGNQYINLGYAAKKNTEIRLDMELIENENTMLSSMTGNVNIIGRDAITENNAYTVNIASSGAGAQNHIYYWIDKTYASGATAYFRRYSSVTPRSTMVVKSLSATFQGKTIEVAKKTEDNVDNMTLLGSFNSDQNKILPFNRYDAKIYGFQIYEGENLVHDYVPSLRVSDGVAGLYDNVDKLFYSSDGFEQFIKGEY